MSHGETPVAPSQTGTATQIPTQATSSMCHSVLSTAGTVKEKNLPPARLKVSPNPSQGGDIPASARFLMCKPSWDTHLKTLWQSRALCSQIPSPLWGPETHPKIPYQPHPAWNSLLPNPTLGS